MTKLYYLRGALGESDLLAQHKKVLEELLSGSYISGDLEKLKGHEVYSFRTSQSARLLFSIREVLGQKYLVVLDYLPNHEYDKSRFLKTGVLKHYLEKHAAGYESSVAEGLVFEVVTEQPEAVAAARGVAAGEGIDYIPLDYYQQKIIEMNSSQQDAMDVRLPAVISGVAGSGKSCVSLSLLVSYLNSYKEEDEARPLLYVSKSRALVGLMSEMWRELPLAQEHPDRIQFKTYDELLPAAVRAFSFTGEADFEVWYLDYVSHQKSIARTKQQDTPKLDGASVYQEFRIACAYSKEAYLALGERQSSLSVSQRPWLYEAYERYGEFLTGKRQIDPAFYRWEEDERYAFVVVDEAQDLSHGQLIQLEKIAQGRSIVYCLDGHQRLFDRRSVRPFLLQHLGVEGRSHIELNVTYRCPVKVVAAANTVIGLKHHLAGGIGDKFEATHMTTAAQERGLGHLCILEPEQLKEYPWLLEQGGQLHCAIVTSKEYVDEARARFNNTPLVFTPEEIKGLEYPIIIAYKIYEPSLFRDAQKRLSELKGVAQPSVPHRPKAGAEDERFGPALNKIYTAYTRALQVLVLCEPQQHHYDLLLKPLKELADKELPAQAWLDLQDHHGDWEKQVRVQLDAGNDAVAQAIFITKLGKADEEFRAFVTKYRIKPTPLSPAAAAAPKVLAKPEPSPSTPPKEKKKGGKSPKTLSSPLKAEPVLEEPKPVEVGHVLALAENFIERRLAAVFTVYGESIWLKPYLKPDGQRLILADLLRQESYRKIFSSYLVSSQTALKKAPFESLLKYFDSEQDVLVHRQLMQLSEAKSNFEKQKIGLGSTPKGMMLEPIHVAAVLGDHRQLHLLYELGANPNQVISGGENLVVIIAYKGDVEMLRALHELGADLNQVSTSDGAAPVHAAAEKGLVEVLRLFAELKIDLNREMVDGTTPAFLAAQRGHVKALRVLHELKVNLKQVRRTDGATLAFVAAKEGRVEVLRVLHELKMDLNQGKEDATPACIAAHMGQVAVLRVLHELKVDLNQVHGAEGKGLVHVAVNNTQVEVLRVLHELKVNLNQITAVGETAALLAAKKGSIEVLRVLCSLGADLNKSSIAGAGPTHIAAYKGNVAMLRVFHELKVDLNRGSEASNVTPAHVAAQNGHEEAFRLLYELGVDLDKAMSTGLTPLFIAVVRGSLGILHVLRDAGVDFRKNLITDRAGIMELFDSCCDMIKERLASKIRHFGEKKVELSALEIAKIMGQPKVIEFLSKIPAPSQRHGLFAASRERRPPAAEVDVLALT